MSLEWVGGLRVGARASTRARVRRLKEGRRSVWGVSFGPSVQGAGFMIRCSGFGVDGDRNS